MKTIIYNFNYYELIKIKINYYIYNYHKIINNLKKLNQ